jgi:hypothetical protein
MRSSQNCGSGLGFPFVLPNTSHEHITQSPVSRPPWYYLVTPMTFLVLVCVQNLCGCLSPCLQNSFTCIVKKFWSLSSFADPESCHHQPNLRAAATRQQDASPLGRARGPSSWTECKILDQAPKLLELKTLLCQKQTHKRQKILTRQLLLIKRMWAGTYSIWADTHAQNGHTCP